MKNSRYWSYNLPLQLWAEHNEDDATEEGPVSGYRVLNYMPRRERCETLRLEELIGEQTREEFLEQTALTLENLARLFRAAKQDPNLTIYYPDEGMDKENS